jgi:hypothetical protein
MNHAWKDERILAAVARLRESYGPGQIAVVDHWPSDGFAIGVECPGATGVLAYLSACEPGVWFVSLESPPGPAEVAAGLPYREVASHTRIGIEEVVEIVGRHLGMVRTR